MKVADKLACYIMRSDGTDGCCVAFAAKECASGKKGSRLDGAIVQIVDVFLPDNPNERQEGFINIIAVTLLGRIFHSLSRSTIINYHNL